MIILKNLKDSILNLVRDTSFNDELVSLAISKLKFLGVENLEEDTFIVAYSIKKVDSYIKSICNIDYYPKEVETIVVDRVCGEVLSTLKVTNNLGYNFDRSLALKSVKMGDTDITYIDSMSNDEKLDIMIAKLINTGEEELLCYRKLKW